MAIVNAMEQIEVQTHFWRLRKYRDRNEEDRILDKQWWLSITRAHMVYTAQTREREGGGGERHENIA